MTRRSFALDTIEPEALVTMNREDINMIGISSGEKVKVITRRGAVELMVLEDWGIPKGMIFIPFCFIRINCVAFVFFT